MRRKAYDKGRSCEGCGSKMPPHFPRKRQEDDGPLLCNSCLTKGAAKVASNPREWYQVGQTWAIDLTNDGHAEVYHLNDGKWGWDVWGPNDADGGTSATRGQAMTDALVAAHELGVNFIGSKVAVQTGDIVTTPEGQGQVIGTDPRGPEADPLVRVDLGGRYQSFETSEVTVVTKGVSPSSGESWVDEVMRKQWGDRPTTKCTNCGAIRPADSDTCPSCKRKVGHQGHAHVTKKIAHDSGDGETIYHCFAGDTRYLTRDGIKSLAETVGTVQQVLTADQNSREGRWVDAMIHSFGEQPLMEVRLRRNQQVKVVYATPEHQWIYRSGGRKSRYGRKPTRELKAGDRLAAALPPRVEGLSLSPEGVRHGIVYGDGTASNGYSSVHLWGEKDKQLLPWFEMTGEASVSPTMTANGVAGVRVSAKMPASYKAVPDTDDLDYLYGWLAGYFAADGNVTKQGNVRLDSADYGSLEAVREIALRLGIATYGIVSKMRQGYGDEPTLLHSVEFIGSTLTEDFFLIESHRDRFRFRDYRYERIGWVVDSVTETDRVEEVFCPRVPGTESFVLEDWLHTAQCPFCGAGQVIGRSDGTAQCEFCDTAFTVQVQPSMAAVPQTIDGEPHVHPEMPGGEPGEFEDGQQPEETEMELEGDEVDDSIDSPKPNPFSSKESARYYRVDGESEAVVDEEAYIRHLAIKFSDDRDAAIEAVRVSRVAGFKTLPDGRIRREEDGTYECPVCGRPWKGHGFILGTLPVCPTS